RRRSEVEAYLAARIGDVIGAHPSIWDAICKVACAIGAGLAAAALVVAVCNPVGLVACAAGAGIAIGTGAAGLGGAGKAIKRHSQPKPGSGLKPHLKGAPCSAVVGVGSLNVFIEKKMAARATVEMGTHQGPMIIQQGSATVLVNNMPLARESSAV